MKLQSDHITVTIGSYPYFEGGPTFFFGSKVNHQPLAITSPLAACGVRRGRPCGSTQRALQAFARTQVPPRLRRKYHSPSFDVEKDPRATATVL